MSTINQAQPRRKGNNWAHMFWVVPLLFIFGAISIPPHHDDASEPKRKMADAAEIGDTLSLKYPASMILCGSDEDSFKVYLSGEMAFSQVYRVDNSMSSAMDASTQAKKAAMAKVYSCHWGSQMKDQRFVVVDKHVSKKDSFIDAASYHLRSIETKQDWWFEETSWLSSDFEKVTKPQPKEQVRD